MEKVKFKNIDFLRSISELPETIEKNEWKKEYDKDLDRFYWTQSEISHNSELINVGNEYSFYINSKGKLEGLFVEYVKKNFVQHNKEFKKLFNSFTKKVDDSVFTVSNKQRDEFIHLSKTIKAGTLETALENDQDYKNLKIPIRKK